MTDVLTRLATALAGQYVVQQELGAGVMATVYRAVDRKHQRDVAIKVLHRDLGAALGGERFLSEVRTTARPQHPHILTLLDSGEAGGLLYYVMPPSPARRSARASIANSSSPSRTPSPSPAKSPTPSATHMDWASSMAT